MDVSVSIDNKDYFYSSASKVTLILVESPFDYLDSALCRFINCSLQTKYVTGLLKMFHFINSLNQ